MKILVTGVAGFIGSHIAWKLSELGYDVWGFDRDSDLPEEADVVVHCAANLYHDFDENIELTKKLIFLYPKAKFIFTSSAAVYGDTVRATEDQQLKPYGAYGYSKMFEETMIREFVDNYTIFRLSNVCGYNSDHGIYQKIIKGKTKLNNNGNSVRDFVHVKDVRDVVIRAIIDPRKWQGTFNIASGEGVSIRALFYKLNRHQDHIDSGCLKEITVSTLSIEKAKGNGFRPRKL